jgi:hypothetical protein
MSEEKGTAVEPKAAEAAAIIVRAAEQYAGLRLEEGVGSFYATVDSVDELLGDLPDAEGLMEYTGRPITIHGATLRVGELEDRMTVFAVIDITDDSSGKRVMATTGASAVLAQLNKAALKKWFPLQCMPYQSELGKKGRTDPLHLGKVDRF